MNKNKNGIVLATLIIILIILSIILSITFVVAFKNDGILNLVPSIKTKNIEKIYQEQLDSAIQQEEFGDNEAENNKKIAEIINRMFKKEYSLVNEVKPISGGYNHKYNLELVDEIHSTKINITLKVKPELNDKLKQQQLAFNSGYEKIDGYNIPTPKDLKVGDTVIYDPTKGVTDQSLLTYTAKKEQTGHDKDQTITATSNHNEWVVISTSGGQVKMMSKEVIDGIEGGTNDGGNTKSFALSGGKGYLYAEEELHKMCSVFGHGKGASKINTKYTVGNPYIGEGEERTLSGSGARSLILSDIVSVIKGEGQDFTEEEKKNFYSGYKTEASPEVYYPTNRRIEGKKSFTPDYYGISKEKYTNYANAETKTAREALVNSIFKDKYYWYGSRYCRWCRSVF